MSFKHVLLLIMLVACVDMQARKKKRKIVEQKEFCGKDKARCENDPNCQCYCGYKPGPRDKTPDDTLIYVENDPYGHYCYCKQRDIDKVKADAGE